MQKLNTLIKSDMFMIRIQALEWVQSQIQDLILDNGQQIGYSMIMTND